MTSQPQLRDQSASTRGTAVLFNPYRDWSKNDHERIIGDRLAALGFDVLRLACDGDLPACDRYWFNAYRRRKSAKDCALCQKACEPQEAKIPGRRASIGQFLTDADRSEIARWAGDLRMSEWTTASFDGMPIAHWSTSSIGTHLRELPVRVDDWTHTSIVRDVIHATATTGRAARRLIAHVRPALVVVFNGRFSPTRAFLEVARSAGIPLLCHESGDRRRADCRLMPDFGIGERGYWDALSRLTHYQALTPAQAEATGQWIAQRFHDPSIPRYATTEGSSRTLWPAGSPRILIAPSSSDESREVDGFDRPGFGSQPKILDWVAECARLDRNAAVVVRAHPNLALSRSWGPSAQGIRFFADYAGRVPANVRVIQPTDPDSSYSYLREADLVVSDFSLLTIEAAALGIPAIAAGRSRYWKTGCCPLTENIARPWSEIVAKARAESGPTTMARARRCLWNMFLGGEFPEDPSHDPLGRVGLGDAVERWATTQQPWWPLDTPGRTDAAALPHELADLSDLIDRARQRHRRRSASSAEQMVQKTVQGASRRLHRAARALLGG